VPFCPDSYRPVHVLRGLDAATRADVRALLGLEVAELTSIA
jgi:hypothetical protein